MFVVIQRFTCIGVFLVCVCVSASRLLCVTGDGCHLFSFGADVDDQSEKHITKKPTHFSVCVFVFIHVQFFATLDQNAKSSQIQMISSCIMISHNTSSQIVGLYLPR